MAYFPFFIELSGRKCLIVGGGSVAARKLEKLRGFGADITLVAPEICGEIPTDGATLIQRKFRDTDLDGAFLVIAATNDRQLNHRIYTLCTERGILVNTVDDIENCGFIFPALVHRDDITVGISTGGKCPAMAKYLRRMIEKQVDEKMLSCEEILSRYRPVIKEMLVSEADRAAAMGRLLSLSLKSSAPPDDRMIMKLLEEMKADEDQDSNTQKQAGSCSD